MRKLVLCSLLFATPLMAQNSKYSGAFMEIPVGGKAMSMGGAFAGIADDESAFHWNPAGVSLAKQKMMGLMYSSEFGSPGSGLADFWHLGFSLPLKSINAAINWVRLSVPDLEHTKDLTGIEITALRQAEVRRANAGAKDYFSDIEDAVYLSVAKNIQIDVDWGWLYFSQPLEIPIGINFKLINQSIGDFAHSRGLGIDAGAMLRFSLGEFVQVEELGKISAGIAATDIFDTRISWSTDREQVVPMQTRLGVSYLQQLPGISSAVQLAWDFFFESRDKARIGLDFTYAEKLSFRAGTNNGTFTAGAGYRYKNIGKVDYALGLHALGAQHRLSFALDIDSIYAKVGR